MRYPNVTWHIIIILSVYLLTLIAYHWTINRTTHLPPEHSSNAYLLLRIMDVCVYEKRLAYLCGFEFALAIPERNVVTFGKKVLQKIQNMHCCSDKPLCTNIAIFVHLLYQKYSFHCLRWIGISAGVAGHAHWESRDRQMRAGRGYDDVINCRPTSRVRRIWRHHQRRHAGGYCAEICIFSIFHAADQNDLSVYSFYQLHCSRTMPWLHVK